jgi:sulfur dioxygenase
MIAPTFVSKLQLAQIVKPVFIDVRLHDYVMKAKKYDLVPNSIHSKFDVDTSEFTDGNIEQQLPSDKNAAIVTYCYRGRRAQFAANKLKAMGYTNVTNGENVAYIMSSLRQDNNVLIRQLYEKESSTYSYIVMDKASREAVLIDPVVETVERDMEVLHGLNAKLLYVLNTHVHADHVTGSGKLKQILNSRNDDSNIVKVQSVISKASGAEADIFVSNGDTVNFGEQVLTVKNTPGHTPGCVTYLLNNNSHAFCGDTVLIGGCGRTDFQGGDPNTLYDSVMNNIFSLPDETILYPGHDYKGRTCTTVGEEKLNNERLTKSKEEFFDLMVKRFDGSNYPKKIDSSLPANMKCGVYEL